MLFLLCSFFLFFFISGIYIYYLYKYPKLPDTEYLLKYYPEDLILRTGGWLEFPDRRLQYFLNFSSLKEKDTIRVGTFGDSFTFGNEVSKTATYPYQLQRLFNRRFPEKKIEILNFGIPGGGLQGQFFLWEKYFRDYGIDYILFGPRGFYSDRDLTFRKNWGGTYFMYPWERFVLSDSDKLKRIHIKGNTLKERYKNYYKLIPSWTALRYDKEPFQIWRVFSSYLKYIPNPFYYKKISDQEESVNINILLLEKIRNIYDKKILFFTDDRSLFDNYSSVSLEYNLNFIEHAENLFYKMFDHKSALGNEIIANIYFNALIGKKVFALPAISCSFKDTDYVSKIFNEDLDQMKSIHITSESIPISRLVQNSSDHDHYHTKGSYFNNRVRNTKSFIGLSSKRDFIKFPYFPLSFRLKKGMKIYIRWKGQDKIALGEIQPLDTFGRFFVFHEDFIEGKRDLHYNYYESYFLLEKLSDLLKQKIKKINKPMELVIEDYKLGDLWFYNLYGRESLRLIPVNGYDKSFLMMGFPNFVSVTSFPSSFPLYIQYNMNNGRIFKSLIPNWKCKKRTKKFVLKLPNFKPLELM